MGCILGWEPSSVKISRKSNQSLLCFSCLPTNQPTNQATNQDHDSLMDVSRGRASVLLSEPRWFDSPGLACWSVPGQDTEPQTAPEVLVGTLQAAHCHQCMNYCKSCWPKASAKCNHAILSQCAYSQLSLEITLNQMRSGWQPFYGCVIYIKEAKHVFTVMHASCLVLEV